MNVLTAYHTSWWAVSLKIGGYGQFLDSILTQFLYLITKKWFTSITSDFPFLIWHVKSMGVITAMHRKKKKKSKKFSKLEINNCSLFHHRTKVIEEITAPKLERKTGRCSTIYQRRNIQEEFYIGASMMIRKLNFAIGKLSKTAYGQVWEFKIPGGPCLTGAPTYFVNLSPEAILEFYREDWRTLFFLVE